MPVRPATQFLINLPCGVLAAPRQPIDIPSGAYFIWPFNFKLGAATLRYSSTTQLFTSVAPSAEVAGTQTFYFEAIPGIPAEFAFDSRGITSVHSSSGETARDSGVMLRNRDKA